MGNIIGISQRISIKIIEQAMEASLAGAFTPELAADLAATEFNGPNRIKKAQAFIGYLTLRNPLFDLVKEHSQEYRTAIKHKDDRAIVFVALINAVYKFGYDITTILGKFFHVQDELTTSLITSKLSEKYSSNRTLVNGLNCILPMYLDTGLISRPRIGFYTKNDLTVTSEFTRQLFKKSFSIHNPMLAEDSIASLEHSYFEFVK